MSNSLWIKCPNCNGLGKIEGTSPNLETCPTCQGKGIISEVTGLPPTDGNQEGVTIKPFTIPVSPSVPQYPWYDNRNITCEKGKICILSSDYTLKGDDTYTVSRMKVNEDGSLFCENTKTVKNIKDVIKTIVDEASKFDEPKLSNGKSCNCNGNCCSDYHTTATTNKSIKYK